MKRLPVKDFLAQAAGGLVLDVRSPAEFAHAHLPGAVSLPLFSNEERAVVGTAYKQESREKAIKIGLDFFGPKMRGMVEAVEDLMKARQQPAGSAVYVYCWRGGMRSGAVAWLLQLYGFEVQVLAGGYKAFRRLCLEALAQPYAFNVLGGYTGSGKSVLLQGLKQRGDAVIDLEGLAQHRGSAFGKMGEGNQPSQEMFENLLATELMRAPAQQAPGEDRSNGGIWIEDESQRIGRVNIPNELWKTMRRSPVFFLQIPFEARLSFILSEYGSIPPDKLMESTERISKRLGGLDTKNTLALLEEGNLREAFRILLRYYDKLYQKGLHNRENLSTLLHEIQTEVVGEQNLNLLPTPQHTI